MTDRFVDREYLTGVQYASDTNLAARQAIYRFQDPAGAERGVDTRSRASYSGDERVLDVGCGNGVHLAELAPVRTAGPCTDSTFRPACWPRPVRARPRR